MSCLSRPFDRQELLFYAPLIEMLNQTRSMFRPTGDKAKLLICYTDPKSKKPLMTMASDTVVDMHMVGAASGASCLPRHRYTPSGDRVDNVTDWALARFTAAYWPSVTKDDIFHYVYCVLHNPIYRATYAQNLKRELPRVPLYSDLARWAGWGARLMALHVGYEAVEPWPLVRTDRPDARARDAGLAPRPILRSDPTNGTLTLDSETVLGGVPEAAWAYRLGNRTALDWVLDQRKERRPKDPTIRERFDTYRFADHKERVIDLLARVTRVAVETVGIVREMEALPEAARRTEASS